MISENREKVDAGMWELFREEVSKGKLASRVSKNWLSSSWFGLAVCFGTIYAYEGSHIESKTALILLLLNWINTSFSRAILQTITDITLNAMSKSSAFLLTRYDDLTNSQRVVLEKLVKIIEEGGLSHKLKEIKITEEELNEVRN